MKTKEYKEMKKLLSNLTLENRKKLLEYSPVTLIKACEIFSKDTLLKIYSFRVDGKREKKVYDKIIKGKKEIHLEIIIWDIYHEMEVYLYHYEKDKKKDQVKKFYPLSQREFINQGNDMGEVYLRTHIIKDTLIEMRNLFCPI